MAYVARKPFLFNGIHYRPGDVVQGFPDQAFRPEGFIRTGMIVEQNAAEPEEVKPAAKPVAKRAAKKTAPAKA